MCLIGFDVNILAQWILLSIQDIPLYGSTKHLVLQESSTRLASHWINADNERDGGYPFQ